MKFVPPYGNDGTLIPPPVGINFGIGSTTQKTSANASAPSGRIRFFVSATAKANAGVFFSAATATGFLESCFEVQKDANYQFEFDYDWSVLDSVPAFIQLTNRFKSHGATIIGVKVIGEIFDKNGALVADTSEVLLTDVGIPIPFLNPDNAYAGKKKLTLANVPLKKASPPSPYRWRFSVTAIAEAWAAGGPAVNVRAICCTPGSPGAPKVAPKAPNKFNLNDVVVTPNVFPTPCP